VDTESQVSPRHRQYRLRTLLAATAVLAVIMALGRWAGEHRKALDLATPSPGALPTEWALSFETVVLALMIAVAAGQGRLCSLLFSKESLIYFGSIAVLTSGFFRYSSGFLFDISLYLILTCCLLPFDVPTLLAAWPMAYAMIAMTVSYLTIMTGRANAFRYRWTIAGIFLGAVAVAMPAFAFLLDAKRPHQQNWTMFVSLPSLVLASLAATTLFGRDHCRRVDLVNIIATVWLLAILTLEVIEGARDQPIPLHAPGDAPISQALTIEDTAAAVADYFRTLGPGYWLLAFGALLILAGSVVGLWSARGDKSHRPKSSAIPGEP
jgi:hypothetical protein